MDSIWQQVLITLGGQAMLLSALAYLIKALLSHRLAKDVETFKAQLQSDANVTVERLKNSLQIAATEHQVRFSKLQEKRALVVAELYALFVTAYWAAHTYHQWAQFPGGLTEEEQAQEAWHALHVAFRFFESNRIYLSETLAAELDNFFKRAKSLTISAQYLSAVPDKTAHTTKLAVEARREGLEAFQSEFPDMRKRLDHEFKKLIGAETEQNAA
ncbi:MAG: hypothetical protein JST16_09080 [Bdellovibrionales bacterium]|nr:hypothetical protein [Bdellovibrionales bacterium]